VHIHVSVYRYIISYTHYSIVSFNTFTLSSGTDEYDNEKDRLLQDLFDWQEGLKEEAQKKKDQDCAHKNEVIAVRAIRDAALNIMCK
jgi:hypothetical protein